MNKQSPAPTTKIGLANNPEFLREGHCWDDFMGADRIVLGVKVILDEASPEALIEKVDGKVWQTSAAIDGADRYLDTHRISNIQLTGRRYTLRIVSDERPDERAESVPPRLEEAYIYLTGGNRDDTPEG